MLALHEIYVAISMLDMYLVKMHHTLLPLLPSVSDLKTEMRWNSWRETHDFYDGHGL